ncbi:MAG: hypothetical protein ACP5TL_03450 [Candidatus Micrarchaeia archaeon]
MAQETKTAAKPMSEYEVIGLSKQISKFIELNFDIKIRNFKVRCFDGLHLSGADALAIPDEHIIYIDSAFILEEAERASKKLHGDVNTLSAYKAIMIKVLAHEIMHMVPTYRKDEIMANYTGTIIAFCLTEDDMVRLSVLKITGMANLGNDSNLAMYVLGGQKAYNTIVEMNGDPEEIMIAARHELFPIKPREDRSDEENGT